MARHLIGIFILVLTMTAVFVVYRTPPALQHTATFAGVSLRLDYATTDTVRERGLAGRANVPEGYGMLFVFPHDEYHGFWMKDMRVPIDIFWLDSSGRVISVVGHVATSTYPRVFYPPTPVRYVLETAAGFAAAHAVATGTLLVLRKFPSVSE